MAHAHHHCPTGTQICLERTGNAADAIADMLARRGAKLTAPRRKVLDVMAAATGPMKAYDILDAVSAGGPHVRPPTIYRALDFLLDAGVIHRIESAASYVLCHHIGHDAPVAFLVCVQCNAITEIAMADIQQQLTVQAAQHGFAVQAHVIEARGICATCAAT